MSSVDILIMATWLVNRGALPVPNVVHSLRFAGVKGRFWLVVLGSWT